MQPLLSVVIPTKNRYKTLDEVLGVILSSLDGNFEIVVQDCSEENISFDAIREKYPDERLRCFKSPANISMTENWNYAFLNTRGLYLIYIGDDDLVCHDIMKVVAWASENNIDSIRCSDSIKSHYYWPDYPSNVRAGTFELSRYSGSIEFVDAYREAVKSSFGCGPENIARHPQIYHGIVKRCVMDELYKVSGKYFDGVSPDHYSAFALALIVKKFCILDYSVSIPGASRKSNSGRSVNGRFPKEHVQECNLQEWPDILPNIECVEIYHSQAMVKAFANQHRFDLVKNINLSTIYALYFFRDIRRLGQATKLAIASAKSLNRPIFTDLFRLFFKIMVLGFWKVGRKALTVLFPSRKNSQIFKNVFSIKEALDIHKSHFSSIDRILSGFSE